MNEVEIKILGIDRTEIEERLILRGARKVFDGEIHAVYYDFSDGSIADRRGTFRLRKEGHRSVLTFKSHIENAEAKVRDEQEVEVSDFISMDAIIKSLGLSPRVEMKKYRTSYELDGLHFEFDKYLDSYAFIPEFLEIEGRDIETVFRYAEVLGFTKQDCRPWDALQVAEYYSGSRQK